MIRDLSDLFDMDNLKIDINQNNVICGDAREWLPCIPDKSIDLIYIDPPFFSNKNYEVVWGNGHELRSFGDRWKGGINHYIGWMRDKIIESHRVLKDTGSIFLHCNYYANHHLRILMSEIFGERNFLNEVIWNKGFRGTPRKKFFQQSQDTILFYGKNPAKTKWNDIYQEYKDIEMKRYNKTDSNGKRYALIKRKRTSGKIYYGKCYPKGKKQNDVIDVPILASTTKERIVYNTQKPEELIKKFIESCSNKNDIVLDFFGGGHNSKSMLGVGQNFHNWGC